MVEAQVTASDAGRHGSRNSTWQYLLAAPTDFSSDNTFMGKLRPFVEFNAVHMEGAPSDPEALTDER